MTTSTLLVALAVVAVLFSGVAFGWHLRRATAWCPRCGHSSSHADCGQRSSLASADAGKAAP